MITELTEEQKALLPVYQDKWIKIGLSTEPIDIEKCRGPVNSLYAAAGLKPPQIIYCPCPISGALSALLIPAILSDGNVSSAVGSSVNSAVDSTVSSAVYSAVGSAPMPLEPRNGYSYCGGSLWAGYAAYYRYIAEVLSVNINTEYHVMAEQSGYYFCLDKWCIVTDRPLLINRDGNGQLHSETGMAIKYRSGWGLSAWHGTIIPNEWLTGNLPSPDKLLSWENIEQRRAGCEIAGWHNILNTLGSVTIDKNPDPEIGELVEANIPDSGKERFLIVQCGTKRQFALPVPPDMDTALNANAWTFNINPNLLTPEVRT